MSSPSSDITNYPAQDPMLALIERAARDPTFSVEKLESLLRLQVEQQKRVALRAFIMDQNAMQLELGQVQRDKPNPIFHSKYASLEALDRAAKPIYNKYGFGMSFGTAPASGPDRVQVTCRLAHTGGHWEEHALEGWVTLEGSQGRRAGATPNQAIGSALTYLRRNLMQLVLNLVAKDDPEDDDGEGQRRRDGNGNSTKTDPYAEWVDRFEAAVNALTDSDAAKELLDRDTVKQQITAMPHGPQRERFAKLRQQVTERWLTPKPDTSEPDTSGDQNG